MGDVFSPEKRSEVMASIRSKGTKIERTLHEIVREVLGHRWRIDSHVDDLPGKPDLVVPSLRLALFADSCFFHSCPEHGRIPDSNRDYWKPKIARNVERDRETDEALASRGYEVVRVWEHELKTVRARATTTQRLRETLRKSIESQP